MAMTVSTTQVQCKILDITETRVGGEAAKAKPIGTTVLDMYEVLSFANQGGKCKIDGVAYDYTAKSDVKRTLTLKAPGLVKAMVVDQEVVIDPMGVEKTALCSVDGNGDAIMARVPHALYGSLGEGIRSADGREAATIEIDAFGEWVIVDIIREQPVIDGSLIPPDSLDLTDGMPPSISPTPLVTPGFTSLFYEWAAVPNKDLVTYEVHVSKTAGFLPDNTTLVAEVVGTLAVVTNDNTGERMKGDTNYYSRIIARDDDGKAPAGPEVLGVPVAGVDPVVLAENSRLLGELKTSLDSAKSDIGTLNTTIIPGLSADLSTAKNRITSVENINIDQAAALSTLNNTTIPGLNNKILLAQNDLASHQTQITTLDNSLSTARGDISTLNFITLPNIKTELNTSAQGYANTAEASAKAAAAADASTKATNAYSSAKVFADNAQALATALANSKASIITDGSFNAAEGIGWNGPKTNNANATLKTDGGRTGANYVRLTSTSASLYPGVNFPLKMQQNRWYEVEFWTRNPNNVAATYYSRVSMTAGGNNYWPTGNGALPVSNDWIRRSYRFSTGVAGILPSSLDTGVWIQGSSMDLPYDVDDVAVYDVTELVAAEAAAATAETNAKAAAALDATAKANAAQANAAVDATTKANAAQAEAIRISNLVKTDVATLNSTTIPNLNASLSTERTRIDTLNNTTIPGLNSALSTANTNITGLQGKFPIKAVDVGFTIGGGNLIYDSNFESTAPATGWATGGASSVKSTVRALTGSQSLLVTYPDNTERQREYQVTDLIVGQKYTWSAYIYLPSSGGSSNVRTSVSGIGYGIPVTTKDAWVRSTMTFTATSKTHGVSVNNVPNSPGTASIDNVQLELGDIPTAYAPRPDEILPGAVGVDQLAVGSVITEKMTANSVNGDRISAGTLNASKITAGSITTDRMTANTINASVLLAGSVGADRITANSISTTQVTASGINGDRITANTLDANRIIANSISTNQIAAGAVNGDRITANTLNADRIVANTITGDKIQANAITTDKLTVAAAAGDDNIVNGNMTDSVPNSQAPGGLYVAGWYHSEGADRSYFEANASAPGGAMLVLPSQSSYSAATSNTFPVMAGETYAVEGLFGWAGSNRPGMYMRPRWYRADGSEIAGVGDIYSAYDLGTHPNGVGLRVRLGGTKVAPTDAVKATLQFYNFNARNGSFLLINNVSFKRQVGAIQIGDGVITTPKMIANTILGDRIAANTLAADKIVAGSITSDLMTANTINGDRIVANTLSASKITAGSITTDRFTSNTIDGSVITAGTLSADKIIANSITGDKIMANTIFASKLVLSDQTNRFVNPTFLNGAEGWGSEVLTASSSPWSLVVDSAGIQNHIVGTTPSTGTEINKQGRPIQVIPGQKYLVSMEAWLDPGYGGAKAGSVGIYDAACGGGPALATQNLSTSASAASVIAGEYTIPAGVTSINPYPYMSNGNNTGTKIHIRNPRIVEKSGADLIVDGAITTGKMTANSINGDRVTANTLNAAKIVSGTIYTDLMTANTIMGDRIVGNTLNADKIISGTITTDKMTANTIAGDRIVANTLNANKIQAGTITSTQLTSTAIDGFVITGATIRTAASGQRVELTTAGLKAYNSGGTSVTSISSSTGLLTANDATLTGTMLVGNASGSRIEITASGTGARYAYQAFYYGADYLADITSAQSGDTKLQSYKANIIMTPQTGYSFIVQGMPTTTVTANMIYNTTTGALQRLSSKRDTKLVIETFEPRRLEALYDLDVRTWFDRGAMEDYADWLSGEGDTEMRSEGRIIERIPGLVAEEVEDTGLKEFVVYDGEGQVESVAYDRIGVAWIPLVKGLRDEVDELKQLVRTLTLDKS